MLFNSYLFIFIFFPLCLAGYYAFLAREKRTAAKLWLILFSFWFYGYFNLSYLLIMIGSILVNYGIHRGMISCKRGKRHLGKRADLTKCLEIFGVVLNLSVLFYFKYTDFFLQNVNALFRKELPLLGIVLPLGISFFTFQQIGFLIDTYRGEPGEVHPVDYALFVAFFPQLIAGPIVSHDEMLVQFRTLGKETFDWERIFRGFWLFLLGLSKKVLIADNLGKAVDHGYMNLGSMGGLDAFLIMIWYALQLYFDFSGYCDMARGLGQMMGIEIPVNFDSPYQTTNIVGFWKKWHITLNRFFTKYVYVPLGGNRRGELRTYRNLLIVFFLSGLWHGAGWNYILWGMLHGILYVIVRFLQKHKKERPERAEIAGLGKIAKGMGKAIFTALNFLYISMAWVYFRAANVAQANELLGRILKGSWRKVDYNLAGALKPDEFWYVLKLLHLTGFYPQSQYILMTLITLALIPIVFAGKNAAYLSKRVKAGAVSMITAVILLTWCVLSLSQVSTFLYFNF